MHDRRAEPLSELVPGRRPEFLSTITSLVRGARERGIPIVYVRHRVMVCGMQTEFCIDATIREAERRGYAVDLVGDAHATGPGGGLSEQQIRDHVNRLAEGEVARILSAVDAFAEASADTRGSSPV